MKKSQQRREHSQARDRQCQRERWTNAGLLYPAQREYRKGREGVHYRPHPDTPAREKIIRAHLAEGHSLADAAEELILLGYDPAKPGVVRRWLMAYCERWIKATSLRLRSRGGTSGDVVSSPPSRAHIQRQVRTLSNREKLSQGASDVLSISVLGANGLLPHTLRDKRGILLPSDKLLNWRRLLGVIEATTDARLMQALANVREVADHEGEQLAVALQVVAGVSAADVARMLLPAHRCKTRHTVAQAALARAVLAQIDPERDAPDARKVGDDFLEMLADGLPEIVGLMSGS